MSICGRTFETVWLPNRSSRSARTVVSAKAPSSLIWSMPRPPPGIRIFGPVPSAASP